MPSAVVYRTTTATASAKHRLERPLQATLLKELSDPALLNHHAQETLRRYHNLRAAGPGQASASVARRIAAPAAAVWSVVRRFDDPLTYKRFLKSCRIIGGDGGVGTLREVRVVSGLPAAWSAERLDVIDDERRAIGFSVVGGEHRLRNYKSVMTVHEVDGGASTVVVESYAVDLPVGNTREETCAFVETILRCNLNSLAEILTRCSNVS